MQPTLSEAIAALKQAKQDPQTIAREIGILEAEIAALQSQIQGKRDLVKTIRKMAGGSKALARVKTARGGLEDVLPAGQTEDQLKLVAFIKKRGPQLASEIAKDTGSPLGPLVSQLTRASNLFAKRADGRWALTPEAAK